MSFSRDWSVVRRSTPRYVLWLSALIASGSCDESDISDSRGAAAGSGGDAVGVSAQSLSGICSSHSFGGHDYLFCVDLKTWDLARAECVGSGMDLARVGSAAENEFVRTGVGILGHSFLGANDRSQEGTWKWIDNEQQFWQGMWTGSPIGGAYHNWDALQPDDLLSQDCATISGVDGRWEDESCIALRGYVCESVDPPPPPSAPGADTACWSAAGLESNAVWPMRGLCPLRRSGTRFIGSQANTVNWVYPAGNDIRTAVAISANGTVYFGSDDTYVYALLPNGALRWRTKTNGAVRSSPLLTGDGAVVIGSDDNYLYALDALTGALRWKTNLSDDVTSSPAVAPDGTIYVGSDSNRLYALSPSGAILWNYPTSGDVDSSPALLPDGTIVIGSDDDFLYALKPDLGLSDAQRLRWKTNLGSDINAIPAIGPGDHFIYARTQGGKLKKVDPVDGHVVTTFTGPSDLDTDSSPAIALDGSIYVGLGHNVYGLRSDLTQKWVFNTQNDIKSSPSIGADGTVYVGADDERIYALRPDNGSVLWSLEASGLLSAFRGTAAIGRSGAIYIGNDDNKLYSIGSFACSATHKCGSGMGPCTDDAGCAAGLACGQGVAERFGLPADFGVCWDREHCPGSSPPECGSFRADCGLCGTVACTGTEGLQPGAPWPMEDQCPQHRGISPVEGPQTSSTLWTLELGKITAQPVIGADNTIYVGSENHRFYAIARNGVVKWSVDTGERIVAAAALGADGRVYFASRDHKLYAADLQSGAVAWTFSTGAAIELAPHIGADRTVYVASSDHFLYAINNENGSERWRFDLGAAPVGSISSAGPVGPLFVATTDKKVQAINPEGAPARLWSTVLPVAPTAGVTVDGRGDLLAAGPFHAFPIDGETGVLGIPRGIISPNESGESVTGFRFTADERIVACTNKRIVVYEPDWSPKWTYFATAGRSVIGCPVASGGRVYTILDDGVRVLNESDGSPWLTITGPIEWLPVTGRGAVTTGRVVVGTGRGPIVLGDCSNDGDCPGTNQQCEAGVCHDCVPSCDAESCGRESACGTICRLCREGEVGCASNDECADGICVIANGEGRCTSCLDGNCQRGQGCGADSDCALGMKCGQNNGGHFGGAGRVCWDRQCPEEDHRASHCGSFLDDCGTCDGGQCVPDCDSRSCGSDGCSGSCGTVDCSASLPPYWEPRAEELLPDSSSVPLGPIDGDFEVTPNGEATYTLPITLPPGINGAKPELSLKYRSNTGPGYLGRGWRLEGFSRIHRCNHTRERGDDDTDIGGATRDFFANDFCLDGERLLYRNSTGEAGRTVDHFIMERDAFVDLELNRNPTDFADSFWIVKAPDGRLLQYGEAGAVPGAANGKLWANPGVGGLDTCTGDCAQQIHDWAIVRSTDRYENPVSYSYEQSVGVRQTFPADIIDCDDRPCAGGDPGTFRILYRYPKEIRWTGTPEHGGVYNIEFLYERLSDDDAPALAGFEHFGDRTNPTGENDFVVGVAKRLSEIRIRRHDEGIRSYLLDYRGSPGGDLLDAVAECALDKLEDYTVDGSPALSAAERVCKPPTRFSYTSSEPFESPRTVQQDPDFSRQSAPVPIELDGRPGRELAWLRLDPDDTVRLTTASHLDGNPRVTDTTVRVTDFDVIDYNDDGRSDLVYSGLLDNPQRNALIVTMSTKLGDEYGYAGFATSDESTWLPSQRVLFDSIQEPDVDWDGVDLIDLNGDGKEDLLACGDLSSVGEGHWQIRFWSNEGFSEPVRTGFVCLHSRQRQLTVRPRPIIIDVTDDGIPDWIWTYGHLGGLSSGIYVLEPHVDLSVYVLYRPVWNERQAPEPEDYEPGTIDLRGGMGAALDDATFPIHSYKIADINGDGRADVLEYHVASLTSEGRLRTFLNTGKGLAQPYYTFVDEERTSLNLRQFEATVVADWNLDGRDDLLVPLFQSWTVCESDGFQVRAREVGYDQVPLPAAEFVDRPHLTPVDQGEQICPSMPDGWGCNFNFPLYPRYAPVTVADFTGEGVFDVAFFDASSSRVEVSRRKGGQPFLLNLIEENASSLAPEEGRVAIRVDYTTTSDDDVSGNHAFCSTGNTLGCRGSSCVNATPTSQEHWPRECLRGPLPIVKASRSSRGLSGADDNDSIYAYSYRGGLIDRTGRGWLGFARFERVAPFRHMEETFTFDNETRSGTAYPFLGVPETQLTVWSGEKRYSEYIESTLETRNRDLLHGYFPIVRAQTRTLVEEPFEPGESLLKTTTNFDYDTHGNQTRVEVLQQAGGRADCDDPPCSADPSDTSFVESHVTEHTFDDLSGPRNYFGLVRTRSVRSCVPQPDAIDVCEAAGGLGACPVDCVTRNGAYTYDPAKHDLETATEEPGAEDEIVASLGRDARGNVETYTISSKGETRTTRTVHEGDQMFPTRITDPEGHTSHVAYHPKHGYVVAEADPNEVTTFYSYDGFGRLARKTRPLHSFSETFEWAEGEDYPVLTQAVAGGDRSIEEFDHRGRPSRTTLFRLDGARSIVDTDYDDAGEVARVSEPYAPGQTPVFTEYTYDARGRVLTATQPDSAVTSVEYEGLWIHSTDGLQHTRSTYVGRRNLVMETLDPPDDEGVRAQTRYSYGPFDRLVRIRDHEGNTTAVERDRFGRSQSVVDPDRGFLVYSYTGFGELEREERRAAVTGALLTTTVFKHDSLGRRTERVDADGTTVWEWDTSAHGIGEIASTISADGRVTKQYTYDQGGRLERVRSEVDGTGYEVAVTQRDAFGRTKRASFPNGPSGRSFEVEYGYDDFGNLKNVLAPTPSGFRKIWEARDSDVHGSLKKEWMASDVVTDREYDVLGRPKTIRTALGAARLQDLEYKFDLGGNLDYRVNWAVDQLGSSVKEDFGYDQLDRLTSATLTSSQGATLGSSTYRYSPLGNIEFQSDVGEYTYDPVRPHAVTAAGSVYPPGSLEYDNLGNVSKRADSTLEYTAQDRVRQISRASEEVTYLYDGEEQRVLKQVAGVESTVFVGAAYALVTRSGTEPKHQYFISNGARVVAQVTWSADADLPDAIDYLHDDHLGSTELVTGSDGTIKHGGSYEAFGSLRSADWQGPGQPLGPYANFGFTGHFHEEESVSGLIDTGARLYDPVLARFLQPDPLTTWLGYSQDLNRYSYAFNAPLTVVDLDGLAERIKFDAEFEATAVTYAPGTLPRGGDGVVELPTAVDGRRGGGGKPSPAKTKSTTVTTGGSEVTHVGGGGKVVRQSGDDGPAKKDPLQQRADEGGGGGGGPGLQEVAEIGLAIGQALGEALIPGLSLPGDIDTLMDEDASGVEKALAAVSIVTTVVPVLGAVGVAVRAVRAAGKAAKAAKAVAGAVGKVRKAAKAAGGRVKLRKGTRDAIEARQPRNSRGEMVDPNTGQTLKPGEIDVGHKPGEEWRKRRQMHEDAGSTRPEVIEAENNPSLYQLEDRTANRSHRFEDP